MRYITTVLFILLLYTSASAQKHHIYGDISYMPGFSVTYNYQLKKNFSAGGGIGAHSIPPTFVYDRSFIPAVYADARVTAWATKKNRFLSFLNLGMNFFKEDSTIYRNANTVYIYPSRNGVYLALGIGYFRQITKRGGGAYLTLMMSGNCYNEKGYSIISERENRSLIAFSGSPFLSLGFKF